MASAGDVGKCMAGLKEILKIFLKYYREPQKDSA